MIRLLFVLLLSSGALSATAVAEPGERSGHAPAVRASAAARVPHPDTAQALVDSARAEMEVGRHWHASRLLDELRGVRELDPGELLLLARAEAGYLSWDSVVEILDGVAWLDDEAGGAGWRLLGRGLEESEVWERAARAYGRYLGSEAARAADDASAVRVRRARALARADGPERLGERLDHALAAVDSFLPDAAGLGDWLALELAEEVAERGDTSAVRRLRARAGSELVGDRGWSLLPRARLAAGDSSGAEAAYADAADRLESDARRAGALTSLADLRRARGDTAAAVEAYVAALDLAPRSSGGTGAAARLLDLDELPVETALEAFQGLAGRGMAGEALEALDIHVRRGGGALTGWQRLERARLLGMIRSRRDEAVEEHRALQSVDDPGLGARNLELWADLRGRQGLRQHVVTLRRWMVERYPESRQAGDVVFRRGDAAQDRGDLVGAEEAYTWLQDVNPSLNAAGLARMRLGQIRLGRGEPDRAAEIFLGYLEAFPNGRRRDEASYWAGRILLESGREEEGRPLLEEIGRRDPFSYYAVQAADLLGRPYTLPGLDRGGSPEPPPEPPPWLTADLRRIDLLEAAGLPEGRAAALDRLTARARDASDDELLAIALALVERDLPIEAINLGWEIRERGRPWSRTLLEVVYPLPYREMVEREARERGLDPILVSALVRQESAFDRDIVSSAGAIGLMQVMPATGRQLARSEGPGDFSVASLETPEVNLHLGTRFFRDMLDRYDGDLPLALSAYNAGPSRANRWRRMPEASDPLRFTERIPFRETRDYVKKVVRNAAIYEALYGGG